MEYVATPPLCQQSVHCLKLFLNSQISNFKLSAGCLSVAKVREMQSLPQRGSQSLGRKVIKLALMYSVHLDGLPLWLRWRSICLQCRRPGFDPLARKIPLEKGMATHSSILAWRIPWTEEPSGYSPQDCKESDTTERLHFHLCTWTESSVSCGRPLYSFPPGVLVTLICTQEG